MDDVTEQSRAAGDLTSIPGAVGPSPPQHATMTRLGNLRWAELQVFTVTGGWVASSVDPSVATVLSAVSAHAAWRARNLADRLPTIGEFRAPAVTVPAAASLEDLMTRIAAIEGDAPRVAVLADVVLPSLVAALGDLAATLSPVADAPSLRIIPIGVTDLEADIACLAELVPTGDPTSPSSDTFVTDVRTALAAAGGW